MIRFLLAAAVAILGYIIGLFALPLVGILGLQSSGLVDPQFLDRFATRVFDSGSLLQIFVLFPPIISAFRKDPRPLIRAARSLGAAIAAGLCWYLLLGAYWSLFWDPAATDPVARAASHVGPGVIEIVIITGLAMLIAKPLLPKHPDADKPINLGLFEPVAQAAPVAPAAPAATEAASDGRLKEQLRKLAQLRDEGLIDGKAYDERVGRLLDTV
jgi:hypothetical protein